jgi:peptide/nickel transport system substrate-binding protein
MKSLGAQTFTDAGKARRIPRAMRRTLTLVGLVVGAALVLVAAGSPRGIKEGGTFKIVTGFDVFVDPALPGNELFRNVACGALMSYPDGRVPPEGLHLRAELAEAGPVVSRDGKTYTFTVRKDARFSDGKLVTARAFAHALERILTPAMESGLAPDFSDIVGAKKMLGGKATTLAGAVAKGRTLTLRLVRPAPNFRLRLAGLCAVPPSLPIDPEGAKAPLPSAAPYYAAQYVPGERLVLERNRFYKGTRVHHVDRFIASLDADPASAIDDIARGTFDCCVARPSDIAPRTAELVRRYGANKPGGQFFIEPGRGLRMFVLNTSRPLFKNNPKLRQAVNFAVDRGRLTREEGGRMGRATDQHLLPVTRGFHDERIYPLKGPDVTRAERLAKGHTRSGKAVLYTAANPIAVAQAQIVKDNLSRIGLEVEIVQHPGALHFERLRNPSEPFDIGWIGWIGGTTADSSILNWMFDGRTIADAPNFGNWSYFDSPKYNRLLEEASRLTGAKRDQAYRELDVMLSRDAAPAIPFAALNAWAFVSARVGCVVMNPGLDLTAVCLK